jgi:hypothetical protein
VGRGFIEGSRGVFKDIVEGRRHDFQLNGSYSVIKESKGRGSVKVCIRVYNFLAEDVLRLK